MTQTVRQMEEGFKFEMYHLSPKWFCTDRVDELKWHVHGFPNMGHCGNHRSADCGRQNTCRTGKPLWYNHVWNQENQPKFRLSLAKAHKFSRWLQYIGMLDLNVYCLMWHDCDEATSFSLRHEVTTFWGDYQNAKFHLFWRGDQMYVFVRGLGSRQAVVI